MNTPHLIAAADIGLIPTAEALAAWAKNQEDPRIHDIGEALECAALSEDVAAILEMEDSLAELLVGRIGHVDGDWVFFPNGRGEE